MLDGLADALAPNSKVGRIRASMCQNQLRTRAPPRWKWPNFDPSPGHACAGSGSSPRVGRRDAETFFGLQEQRPTTAANFSAGLGLGEPIPRGGAGGCGLDASGGVYTHRVVASEPGPVLANFDQGWDAFARLRRLHPNTWLGSARCVASAIIWSGSTTLRWAQPRLEQRQTSSSWARPSSTNSGWGRLMSGCSVLSLGSARIKMDRPNSGRDRPNSMEAAGGTTCVGFNGRSTTVRTCGGPWGPDPIWNLKLATD